jgi:hypothetical protein
MLMLLPILSPAQDKEANAFPADQMKPLYTEPCLSGDGTEIAFVSGGDIWTVPLKGGAAHLLVSTAEHESALYIHPIADTCQGE